MAPVIAVGVGCSRGCPAAELLELIRATLAGARPDAIATVDLKADEPGLLAAADELGLPVRLHAAGALAAVDVPTPSAVVAGHVGTPSVAEAAALLTAGPGARLIATKQRSAHATCAVAAT
jgi:cobalamin biosynthesis protein CbiG